MLPPDSDNMWFSRLGYWALIAAFGAAPVLILKGLAPGVPTALIFVLYFAAALVIVLLLFSRWYRLRQSSEWERHGFCPHCGYPRTGLTAPRCPECGTSFTDGSVQKKP